MRIVTKDLHEAIDAVTSVYCPHDVHVMESNHGIDAVLETSALSRQQAVALRYSAPVEIDAGNFDNLLLFMTCVDGAAVATQGRRTAEWGAGSTLPLSPGVSSQLVFNRRFWQRSIRLDRHFVEELCARLINRPLDFPLRFQLTPFEATLEATWQQMLSVGGDFESEGIALPPRTLKRYEEMLAILVLETHPHNYSDVLKRETSAVEPRLVREAEHLMRTGDPEMTVSEIAKTLRVSLRGLELGFREARRATPTGVHRRIRLKAARAALLDPTGQTSVTSVAIACGFSHLARFSRYYQDEFSESPRQTLRRGRASQ